MTHSVSGNSSPTTIAEFIATLGQGEPEAVTLLDRHGTPMGRRALAAALAQVSDLLRAAGLSRNDRVALLSAPGPGAAVALLGTMATAVAAPLNPLLPAPSLRADLRRLGVGALLLEADAPALHQEVAAELGLRVLRLPLPTSAPLSTSVPLPTAAQLPAAEPANTALLLQTSGTTSQPKLVPLSHANLLASARHTAAVLELGPEDRSLCAMPLFHIHGIVASLLAPLISGGSVICAEPLPGEALLELLRAGGATWLSAVPTLLQGLAGACEAGGRASPPPALRLLRSCSSALPPVLAERLETLFGVPVIEAYGMTEAAQQISSNRLPPARRLRGSVGQAAGPELTVLDANRGHCAVGEPGEVAIRGVNVTAGYGDRPGAGWVTARDGTPWFPTGDEGWLDADGVLTLTGRLKEMINRGGEKVIPRQIDEALLEHPAVLQAVAFAVPHPTLGEDLAAAVVLRAGAVATEDDLRGHCFACLAGHQVPSRILSVEALPKGATGKLQRIGLAERLSTLLDVAEAPLEGEVEELVGEIFAAVLGLPIPSRESNFFALGGDSLTGQQVVSRLNSQLPLDLPATLLFRFPTPRMLAAELDGRIDQALAALEADGELEADAALG